MIVYLSFFVSECPLAVALLSFDMWPLDSWDLTVPFDDDFCFLFAAWKK
jgi:hypothetical protein